MLVDKVAWADGRPLVTCRVEENVTLRRTSHIDYLRCHHLCNERRAFGVHSRCRVVLKALNFVRANSSGVMIGYNIFTEGETYNTTFVWVSPRYLAGVLSIYDKMYNGNEWLSRCLDLM